MGRDTIRPPTRLRDTEIPAPSYKTIGRVFVLCVLAIHAFFLWKVRERIVKGDPDFTAFYSAGKILREGQVARLYDAGTQQAAQEQFTLNSEIRKGPLSYIHPPFEALLFVPLTYLPYNTAFVVWEVANLFILFAGIVLLRQVLPIWQSFSSWELPLWALAFFPIFATFHQGQDAILLLLVAILSFRALERESNLLSGCWLGFGVFKYHLILPLALLIALWRGRKFASGFAVSAAALGLISLALTGWQAGQYFGYVWQVASHPSLGGLPLRGQPDFAGLLGGWPVIEGMRWPVIGISLACSALLFFKIASLRRQANYPECSKLYFACSVIAALLAAYGTNTYDLSLLVICVAVAVDYAVRSRLDWRRFLLPMMPLLISPLWFFLWLRWGRINLIAIFLIWWVLVIRKELLRASPNPAGSLVAG